MRLLQALVLTLFFAGSTFALPLLPITFQDALAANAASDVIGNPALFDIDYLKINSYDSNTNTLQVQIRFNFGGGTSLSPFTIHGFSPALNVGDLFFTTASSKYAFVLNGHDGLGGGDLYKITGTQTAQSVLGNPAGSYRNNARVWASPTGAQLQTVGQVSTVTVNGTATSLLTTLSIVLTSAIKTELDNGFDIYFAAATCGNDEITGTVASSAVPEPATWVLLSGGLITIGLLRRGR